MFYLDYAWLVQVLTTVGDVQNPMQSSSEAEGDVRNPKQSSSEAEPQWSKLNLDWEGTRVPFAGMRACSELTRTPSRETADIQGCM